LLIALLLLCAVPAQAKLAVLGKGAAMRLDPASLPPQQREVYERVLRGKCMNCHSMERIVISVKTGIAPISGLPFNKLSARRYGVKMMRKLDSGMTPAEIRDAVGLLEYLLDEAAR
jgi:hypothetical protein